MIKALWDFHLALKKTNYFQMKKGVLLLVLFLSCLATDMASAKGPADDKSKKKTAKKHKKKKKKRTHTARIFYIGTGGDGAMFSTAFIHHAYPYQTTQLPSNTIGTVRFSGFINIGAQFNYNFSDLCGLYTGIDIKNIGFDDYRYNDSTVKRRSYNVGIPLGFKIGNMNDKKGYGLIGGGIDKPINYKQKQYLVRSDKTIRFSEWFSNATPQFMPYVFIGGATHGAVFKLQYYPGNFLNPGYRMSNGYQTNYGYDVHVLVFSAGYWIPISRRHVIKPAPAANGRRKLSQ